MSLWDNVKSLFKRDKATVAQVIYLLNQGYSLLQVGRDLYNIPEIRTAINFIAEKVGSVPFYHVRADPEGNISLINDRVNFVLTARTNPYQGPQVFWTHVITRALLVNNCFIMPWWDDKGNLLALYPLPFTQFEYSQDSDGRLIITFTSNGNYKFYYDDIIHLQRFPTLKGGAKQQATGNYVEIVDTIQAQAVQDSKTAGRIAAIFQPRQALKGPDMKKKLEEFKELFLTAENTTGFGMVGSDYDVKEVNLKRVPLDTKFINDITRQLYNYFGVSYEIINNTANELQYEQFIDNTVKPWVYQIEEELTYKLFSNNEIYHYNKIQAETVDLEISTLSAKTAFYKEMVYGTIMTRNEIRKRLGLPKGPPELDKFLENKNFQTLKPGNYVVEGSETDGQTDGQQE